MADAGGASRTAAAALGWSATQAWLVQAVRLAAVIAMARLLTPADLGLFAFAAAVVATLQLLVGQGLGAALTQRSDLEAAHVTAALTRMLVGGAALTAVVMVGAGAGGLILRHAEAAPVLRVLSVTFILNAIASVATSILRRRLDLRANALAVLAAESVGAAVGVFLAWRGFGVWSLVARQLLVSGMTAALSWLLLGRTPLPRPERRHFGELGGPGRQIALGNGLVMLRERFDEVVVGALFGVEALGLYALARRQVEALSSLIPSVIHNAAWPLFTTRQKDPAAFADTLTQAHLGMAAIAWPAYAVFAAGAPLWAPLMLGEQWAAATPLIVGLCAIAAVRVVVGLQLIALIAIGQAGRRLILEVAATVATYLAMLTAARFGVTVAVFAAAVAVAALAPIELILIARGLPTREGAIAAILSRGALLTLAAGGAALAIQRLAPLPAPGALVGMLAGAGTIYFVGLRLGFPQVWRLALGRLARARQATGQG